MLFLKRCSDVFDERREQGQLVASPHDGVVSGGEVVEVADERRDSTAHVDRLQHVRANELVEVVDCLHRHRLVEEVKRLIGGDAEPPPEERAVLGEAVADRGADSLEPLAEILKRVPGVGEVGRDLKIVIADDEEPVGLAAVFPRSEHLSDGGGRRCCLVAEDSEQDRIVLGAAQGDGPRSARLLVVFGLIVAQHVRAKVAFASLGTGRLVVRDPVGWHQQGGHCVDECGLAGPDVPCEESVASTDVERPHALIEGAPVVDLETVKPAPRQGRSRLGTPV